MLKEFWKHLSVAKVMGNFTEVLFDWWLTVVSYIILWLVTLLFKKNITSHYLPFCPLLTKGFCRFLCHLSLNVFLSEEVEDWNHAGTSWPRFIRWTFIKMKMVAYCPHMLIGKMWIYHSLLVCVCVCTVTDFSTEDKASSGSLASQAGYLPF